MKIAIVTPVHRFVEPDFHQCSLALVAHSARKHIIDVQQAKGSNLAASRNTLVKYAQSVRADWLLWLDADQTFPPDALVRLLRRDLPLVGCNYVMRTAERTPTACKGGERVTAGRGVEQVDTLGLGLCLMSMDLFQKVPQPWFAFPPEGEDVLHEDEFFFRALASATGVKPFVDHDLSAEVGHITAAPQFLEPAPALSAYRFSA